MSLLTVASGQSVWRGYEYYTEHKVLQMQQTGERIISGTVSGSDGNVYHATIDIDHPKRSKCDCPHAAGRLVVCKHMIAIYSQPSHPRQPSILKAWKPVMKRKNNVKQRWPRNWKSMLGV